MTLSNKNIKKAQSSALTKGVEKIKSITKVLVVQKEEKLEKIENSELLILQINSGENEILFI